LAVGVIIGAAFGPIVTSLRCRKLLRYLPNSQTQPSPGRCLVLVSPSHGENRRFEPLGSANIFKDLADCYPSASNTCPINVCGQRWTIRFASCPRLEGGRLGTNAPIVKDAARFEIGTRKCGLMKNPHSRPPSWRAFSASYRMRASRKQSPRRPGNLCDLSK